MSTHMEREFKWQAGERGDFRCFLSALKEAGALVSNKRALYLTDYYLDDQKQTFSAARMALRIRRNKGHFEATLKTRSQLQQGLAVRQEMTRALPAVRSVKGTLNALLAVGAWNGVVGLTALQVRFIIQNNRILYDVCYGRCRGELALDRYVTRVGTHRLLRREIELELKVGNYKDFAQLAKKLSVLSGLKVAKISKVAGAEKWIKQKFRFN